jgi:hypothetical protein
MAATRPAGCVTAASGGVASRGEIEAEEPCSRSAADALSLAVSIIGGARPARGGGGSFQGLPRPRKSFRRRLSLDESSFRGKGASQCRDKYKAASGKTTNAVLDPPCHLGEIVCSLRVHLSSAASIGRECRGT